MPIGTLNGVAWGSLASYKGVAKANIASVNGVAAASPGFTFVNSNGANTAGSGTSASVQLTGVVAGNLIVVVTGTYSSTKSIDSLSDGTSSLTAATERVIGATRARIFYILSSVASGTVTYTVSYSDSTGDRSLHVYQFSYTGSASLSVDAHANNANSTALDSADFTIAGNNLVVVGTQDEQNAVLSDTTINGQSTSGIRRNTTLKSFYLAQSSGFTGDVRGTFSVSTRHAGAIVGFVVA